MMNPADLVKGLSAGQINYAQAINAPAKEAGIPASYIRNHVGPAFAAILGVFILTAAVMWMISAFSSTTSSMKCDNKIMSGDKPKRDRDSFNRGGRPHGRK